MQETIIQTQASFHNWTPVMSRWAVGRGTEGSSSHVFFGGFHLLLQNTTYFHLFLLSPHPSPIPTLREFALSTVEDCVADMSREGVGNANSIPTLPTSLLHFIPAMQA